MGKRRDIFGQPFLDKSRPLIYITIQQLMEFLNWNKISDLSETETTKDTQDLSIRHKENSLQLSDINETLDSCSDTMEIISQE